MSHSPANNTVYLYLFLLPARWLLADDAYGPGRVTTGSDCQAAGMSARCPGRVLASQLGDNTQKPPGPWAFWGGAGEGITTARASLRRGAQRQGQSADRHLPLYSLMNKIQKRVYRIAPHKARGKITCPKVTPGACSKVQPAARFVKGEWRGDPPLMSPICAGCPEPAGEITFCYFMNILINSVLR